MKLDIGSGASQREGYRRLDKDASLHPDIVWDIENTPWPIEDGEYDEALMSHVIEHVKPWLNLDVMNECWRILKPDGILLIATPQGGGFRYWMDPTHCNGWNEMTVQYFCPSNRTLYGFYRPKPWKLEELLRNSYGDLLITLRRLVEEYVKSET